MKNNAIQWILLLMVGQLVAKLFGGFQELFFSYRFGASAISDAFILTRGIPDLLFVSVVTSTNAAFIPIYTSMVGDEQRHRFVCNLISMFFFISAFGCIILTLFPRQVIAILAHTISSESMQYAIVMLRIVSFSLIPMVMKCIFQAFCQSHGEFVSTSIASSVPHAIMIAFCLMATEEAYYILSAGIVISQFFLMLLFGRNAYKMGFSYQFSFDYRNEAIRRMFSLSVPMIIADFAWNMSVMVDRNLAARLGEGYISSIFYGQLVAVMLSSMVVGAVSSAVFPDFARIIAREKTEDFAKYYHKYVRFLCYALVPVVVFTLIFSKEIVTLVLERGALQSSFSRIIQECTVCYVIGILPDAVQKLMVKAFHAFQNTKTPAYVCVFSLICNIGLSIWGASYWGHIGIAAATSISQIISFFVLAYWFKNQYNVEIIRLMVADVIRVLVLVSIPATSTFLIFRVFYISSSLLANIIFESCLFFLSYTIILLIENRELRHRILLMVRKHLLKE